MKEFIEQILGLLETTHSILMSHTRKLEKLEKQDRLYLMILFVVLFSLSMQFIHIISYH